MKTVNTEVFSNDECWGIQINGLSHCNTISCRWQSLSACEGVNIIKTGYNSKGYKVGKVGVDLQISRK